MIWTYRALNNPAARKKWLYFVLFILLVGFGYAAFRVLTGDASGRFLIAVTLFTLFVSLYTIITLGKPRHYYIEEDHVYYKPFKTNLKKIEGFEVDESKMLIKLKGAGLFSIRTLYFENLDDLRQVERKLKRITGKI